LVCCFFENDLEAYQGYLNTLGVPFTQMGAQVAMPFPADNVFTVNAFVLASPALLDQLSRQPTPYTILMMGHYPIPDRESNIIGSIALALKGKFTLSFWISLEDPLMKAFGSDRIVSVMESLGMKEDECIEHSMVTKSIERARKKIAEKVRMETECASAETWFETNLKQGL
jgi:hypothetical protein